MLLDMVLAAERMDQNIGLLDRLANAPKHEGMMSSISFEYWANMARSHKVDPDVQSLYDIETCQHSASRSVALHKFSMRCKYPGY